jgi:F0F1-type ATP synthase assembly protein I
MSQPEEQKPKGDDSFKSYLKYSGLAFQMIGAMVLAAWGGSKLDEAMGNENPWMTIVLLVVAVIGTMVLVIISLSKK